MLRHSLGLLAGLLTAGSAMAGEVRVAEYGTTRDGAAVRAYTLVNDRGAGVTVLNYGGAITSIRVPDRLGQLGNVVMSYADLAGWEAVGHANAITGRYANRIRNGFTLDGVHHRLQQNPAGITLHGGPPAYAVRVWTVEPVRKRDGARLTLSLDSPDGDQGFPGRLKVLATYSLTNDNALRLDFTATTDRATVINLTNHIYFNLNGSSTAPVQAHRLKLEADRIAVKDPRGMPSGELKPTAGTSLALDRPIPLSQLVAAAADPAFAAPRSDAPAVTPGQVRNFDHSYTIRRGYNRLGRVAARLEDDASGRFMEMRTTETSVQVFIPAASRPGLLSDVGKPFQPGPAVALETQHLPDSPNQPAFPSTVLRPGQTFQSTTIFRFGVLSGP